MLHWSHRTVGQLIIRIQQNSTLGTLTWSSRSHHCRTPAHCHLENDWSSSLRDLILHRSATLCQEPNKKGRGRVLLGFFLLSFPCLCYRFPGKLKINFRNWKKKTHMSDSSLKTIFSFFWWISCAQKSCELYLREDKPNQTKTEQISPSIPILVWNNVRELKLCNV